MAKRKKSNNDQGHIIDAICRNDFNYVWEHVKHIGYEIIPNNELRMMICSESFKKFDPSKSDNFILFFRKNIQTKKMYMNYTYVQTKTKKVQYDLNRQNISPEEKPVSNLQRNLSKWS